jgi:hypothetical protein
MFGRRSTGGYTAGGELPETLLATADEVIQ